MRPFRLSLFLSSVVLAGAVVTGCSVRTERTVYTPAPVAVAPAPAGYYYVYPTTTYYREPYHTGYYSSY